MVNNHSDRERKPAAATTWATLSDKHHPTDRITHTTVFVTLVVAGRPNSPMDSP